MLLLPPENFSENGARPVQFLGRNGRLIGWARSFSDLMTVTDITMLGGRSPERLTRIAGRDVRTPDGHTVGKTFSRKGSLRAQWQWPPSPAASATSASNHNWVLAVLAQDPDQRVDLATPRMRTLSCLQNGARETGLGHWLPGLLRSNKLGTLNFHGFIMSEENSQ